MAGDYPTNIPWSDAYGFLIPALFAPPNPNCATTCCVTCHVAPQECGKHCWTCAQHWADMEPVPGCDTPYPATERDEDSEYEYAREDAPLLQEDRR